MSAAESSHVIESKTGKPESTDSSEPTSPSVEKLKELSPPDTGPLICVDLDDVLCMTNEAVAQWHNEVYGTQMDVSDFYYYYYWKNPYWGDLKTTFSKVKDFYNTGKIYEAKTVPGAREGTRALKDLGFRLIIVTARAPDTSDQSWEWVNHHFPGIFESIICTGQFKDAHKTGHEVVTKLSKAQVCADLGAQLLIDDSAENAMQCVKSDAADYSVLLFGDYEWNKRLCSPEDSKEDMCFDIRFEREGKKEFWKEERALFPEGSKLERLRDWSAVVNWVQKHLKER